MLSTALPQERPGCSDVERVPSEPRQNPAYAARFPGLRYGNFHGVPASPIGVGPSRVATAPASEAIVHSVAQGINVIDTAPQWLRGDHERCVGQAIETSIHRGLCKREDLIVCTRVGVVPSLFDVLTSGYSFGAVRDYVEQSFVRDGTFQWADLSHGFHVITPGFIARSLECSLENLQLNQVNCVYLDRPELAIRTSDREDFLRSMRGAFEALERACQDGKAKCYGIYTRSRLSMPLMAALATEVAGDSHRLRSLHVPLSLGHPSMITEADPAPVDPGPPVLRAARDLGMYCCVSECLDGGRPQYEISPDLYPHVAHLRSDTEVALLWALSASCVDTAILGMRSLRHVDLNRKTAEEPVLGSHVYLESNP